MQTPTRREFLSSAGPLGGALGVALSSSFFALEEVHATAQEPHSVEPEREQPGDQVGAETRAQRLRALLERAGDRPVVMLNLLKFKTGGETSYNEYGRAFATPMQKYAPKTQVLFAGRCEELLIGQQEWDRVILVRYPSLQAFVAVTSSPEYAAIAHLRTQALERSVLYALSPLPLPTEA